MLLQNVGEVWRETAEGKNSGVSLTIRIKQNTDCVARDRERKFPLYKERLYANEMYRAIR